MEKTQQDMVRERLEHSARNAAQAAVMVWQDARSSYEKLAFCGGLIGLAAFFAPSILVRIAFFSARMSGWRSAKEGYSSFWLIPAGMVFILFWTWWHLNRKTGEKRRAGRWILALGSAMAWHWVDTMASPWMALQWGGWLGLAASGMVAAAGWGLSGLENVPVAEGEGFEPPSESPR